MNRRTFTIIAALILVIAFFLPYVNAGGAHISGFDSLFGKYSKAGKDLKYLWLVIPIVGLLLLYGELKKKYFVRRHTLCWIPLLILLLMLFIFPLIDGSSLKTIFNSFSHGIGIGMWLTIAASIALAFYKPRH